MREDIACWTHPGVPRVDGRAHPTLPDAVPGIERGGSLRSRPQAPERHRRSGGPGCNRKAASDIRNRWRAHRDGGSVHMHLDVDVRARYATDPRRSAVKFRPPNRSRSPLRKTTSNRGSELASREASGSAGQGLGPAFGSSPSWAEQAAQRP